jgi:serine/threonine protein kinase
MDRIDGRFDDSEMDNERTTTAPPRRMTGAPARAPAARPAPAVEPQIDPESDEELANLVGEVVDGRYRVERLLGTGGMGAVYEAEHIEIGKKVALKVLHPQFSRQADLVARFRREARAASKVGHPNIVDVTDSGTTSNGDVYFVMERLDGLDLGEVLRHERRVAPDRTVQIGTQICRALSAAHAAGIIHRDLKPENIFLVSRDGNADFVKVLDFGIAKQDMGNQNHPRRLTTPGIAMGTPEYMAPEQAAGKAIDGRVDIYSVGAILYEMLTGEPPHAGPNVMDILTKKATQAPTAPRQLNQDVPEPLEHVVLACLEREPDDRPQTMGALEYELNKSMKGRGSAVAAVLGLKPPPVDDGANAWLDNPITNGGGGRARPLSSPGFVPPPTPAGLPTGMTGALPLAADDAGVRVQKRQTRDSIPAIPFDEKNQAELKRARRGGRSNAGWLVLAGVLVLGGGGYAAYKFLPSAKPTRTAVPVEKVQAPPETAPPTLEPAAPAKTAKGAKPSKNADDDKMSPAEIDRMLEWARRTADGGRITAPPGDNLKELLDRIEKADPGNAGAEALKSRTVALLQRKGNLALKKGRVDEAVVDLEALAALKPDDEQTHKSLARALRMRSESFLGKHKLQAALVDVNAALELEPDDTMSRITLADVLLAQGKPAEAAEEYQRILDGKPADKRAKRGLLQANMAKKPPPPKKKKPLR